MKKNRFCYLSLFALAAGMFSACSSDETMSEIVGPDGETAYAKVSISFPGANRFESRAFSNTPNEFENGTNDESEIKSLLFVFYDEDGRAVGHTKITSFTGPNPADQNANVQDRYEIEVPVNLVPGSKMPTHIMCYANPMNESDQYTNLSDVYSLTRNNYRNDDGFTMNNSVYYEGQNRVIATAIPDGGLRKEGETTALTATEIYIERIAAKVSVNTEDDFKVEAYEVTPDIYLKFVPEAWSVTATEKTTNLVKNLPATLAGNNADVQTWISGTNRTYWGHSVSYQETFSADGFPMTGWDVNTATTKLNYLSYKDITANNNSGWGGSKYFLETTGRSERLSNTSINGNLALPNAIIVGHYEVYTDKAMTTKAEGYDKGFYLYASQIFKPGELVGAMLSNHQSYLRTMSEGTATSLTDDQIDDLFDMAAVKKFYQNSKETDAAKHFVAPQATTASLIANLEYFNGTDWTSVTTANIDTFNDFIVKQTNCAVSYIQGGKAFYTVLIEHYGKKGNDIIEGSYGLVRNHTYKIGISKIAGLASGINDEDDPLIPQPDEVVKFKVSANLNVLSWHVVTQSGVEL